MFEQHISEESLKQKIILLFEYRLFPELISKANDTPINNEIFWKKLVELQTAIYHLDAHLEAHWNTDITTLNWHWNNIVKYLSAFNIVKDDAIRYLNHIKKYEKHELELRIGKLPIRLDMEYFYFYKSCDVKLLRRLIYENYKLHPECGRLSDWRYYDLVTEVNDDVEDLFEDLDFINGNRFLISLLYYERKETKRIFLDFLDSIAVKAKEKFDTGSGVFKTEIYEKTILRVNETKELVYTQLEKLKTKELESSKLNQFVDVKALSI